jgi:SAM-dependent methyltransferase
MAMNKAPSKLKHYFEGKLKEHGPTARGVDWNSERRQEICFRQLVRIVENPHGIQQNAAPTILDYGCGYGALARWLVQAGIPFSRYQGFDFTPSMIEQARHLFGALENVEFTDLDAEVAPADFVIASGLLGLKLNAELLEWESYVFSLVERLWSYSHRGFAFNSLTSYSDPERMRPDLYYPDPARLFDFCKRNLSRNVSVLHDYGLYEFTILVRRDEEVVL